MTANTPMPEDAPHGADRATELTQIAAQLRALSNNGLQWTEDPYQDEGMRG